MMNEHVWEGVPIARGIGMGLSHLLQHVRVAHDIHKPLFLDQQSEIHRYQEAVRHSISEIELLQRQLKAEKAYEGVAVLDTHLELLHDPILTSEIEEGIKKTSSSCLFVLQNILSQYEQKFNSLKDPFFKERFRDIQDVANRLMQHLGKKMRHRLEGLPKGVVLFASDLVPSEVASLQLGTVAALVTERGGATSHVAIIAKAKGIPYVSQLTFDPNSFKSGVHAIVDGEKGLVIFNPDEKRKTFYSSALKRQQKEVKSLQTSSSFFKTLDGVPISLSLNVGTLNDLPPVDFPFACGLFRTEFLLNEHGNLPEENEQFEIYKVLLQHFKNKPVVIRAFDLGGDKGTIIREHLDEENPALGLRAIRLLLKEPNLFKPQIRALLRSAPYGQLKFLLPMVTSYEEILRTKELIEEFKQELEKEGHHVASFAGLGCMIEVPSTALILEALAKECDFFSIGTNDLLQFLFAVDRNTPHVIQEYSPFHPSAVRLLNHVIQETSKTSIPLSICGEMASDPTLVPLLIGLGVREFSLSLSHLSAIRDAIIKTDSRLAREKVRQSLSLPTTFAIKSLFLN